MRIRMKLAIIASLILLLTIPLFLVVSKIYERDNYRQQAREDIARAWTGEQRILGPILVMPYTRVFEIQEFNKELDRYVRSKREVTEQLFILPDSLAGKVELSTETRYRGIYEVPVYTSAIRLDGVISNARIIELRQREDIVAVHRPYLSIAVDDMRGITESPELTWNGESLDLVPGSELTFQSSGIHAPLNDTESDGDERNSFSLTLTLRGMSSFHFAPVGASTLVSVASSWPHPSFDGLYSPNHREISSSGFAADWKTSAFATNITRKADDCANGNCAELMNSYLGVVLIDPVDVYLQAQRASKYGILFIGLTFTAFFLFEVLRRLSIHPIQYTLVGLALTVFYLLLISLAEHIPFVSAYWIATGACSGLLGFYITYVLKSIKRGVAFAAAIVGLYGVLYVIIQEEDYAFFMGASLIFLALSGVMYVTRDIDWFQISQDVFIGPEDAAGK
jgi:inner membrane protein